MASFFNRLYRWPIVHESAALTIGGRLQAHDPGKWTPVSDKIMRKRMIPESGHRFPDKIMRKMHLELAA